MAVLKEKNVNTSIEKEKKIFEAIQQKAKIQEKKANFGKSWKENLSPEELKQLINVVGDEDCPRIKDIVDLHYFFDPVKMFRDSHGGIVDLDYNKYIEVEKAYGEAIERCDEVINDDIKINETTRDKLNKQLKKSGKKSQEEKDLGKKERQKRLRLPEYLQNFYVNVTKYFGRYAPLYDKYICTCCGRPLPQEKYYTIYNEVDISRVDRKGKMHTHICIDCCKKLYEYLYFEKAGKDNQAAMKYFCSYLNIYFDEASFLKALKALEENEYKNHIVQEYMNIIMQSASLKGKIFLESPEIGQGRVKGDDKSARIINSADGSVPDDIEEGWTKADLEAKKLVLKMVGYDPFYFEVEKNRKILYKDLLGMMESGMELDGLKVQAAIQIVLAFSRIREYNERERQLIDTDAPVTELKNLADLRNKQMTTITNFSRDNGFGERYAISKAKGENTFTGIMNKMNEMKYEDSILNMYDIETSESINQAAEASIKAIMNQLNLSEAEVYTTCQEQLKRLTDLQRENTDLQEKLRLAKREVAEYRLKEQKKQYDKDHGIEEDEEAWNGY